MLVIVYGYEGSGPTHWQRWLEGELQRRGVEACFPELPTPAAPRKDEWVEMLARVVEASPRPVSFVAHSLGCWAVDHFVKEHGTRNVRSALLVAPPSPHLLFEAVETFLPPPRDRAAWAPIAARSLLVGSDNDDYTSAEEFAEIAEALGLRLELIPGAGHINVDSGHGPWAFALDWALAESGAGKAGGSLVKIGRAHV